MVSRYNKISVEMRDKLLNMLTDGLFIKLFSPCIFL